MADGAYPEALRERRANLTELLNHRKDRTSFRNAVLIAPLFDAQGTVEWFLGSQVKVGTGSDAPLLLRQRRAAQLVSTLSPRQREVLKEMAAGYRNKQIGWRLQVGEKTVKMHRALLLEKLGVTTTADAIQLGVETGL